MSVSSKMTALADSIRSKSGASGLLGLDAMKASVDNIVTPEANVTYSQVNTAVKAYLDYVAAHPYDSTDCSYSYVEQFTQGVTNGDKPLGAAVNVKAGKLSISDSMGGTEVKTVSAGTQTIYNIAPMTDGGNYISLDASGNIVGCGHLIPNGALRMINCPAARNVRDLGGWACDGGTVKYGKIFRGGVPAANDRGVLVDWLGVSAEFDLRGRSEAEGATQSPLGSDVQYFLYDNFVWFTISNKVLWKAMLVDIFNCVKNGETVYFHCGIGADRTGTMACVLEALLGVSQSDMDTDYELTSFYQLRKRNYGYPGVTNPPGANWCGLINELKAVPLVGGLTDSFRNHAVSFVLSLGFTIDEINAFRNAMIDGTPTAITVTTDSCSVTNTLSNVSSDNDDVSVDKHQPYEANITPANGYVISSVQITMGGVDITEQAWNGAKTNLNIAITNTLSHCSTDNARKSVIAGQMYYANISADSGYTLEGATVSITMGGVDVSTQYYSNGKIAIPNVTGNIVINITAAQSAPSYTNLANPDSADWLTGQRIRNSGEATSSAGAIVTNYIPVTAGDTIRIKGLKFGSPSLPDGNAASIPRYVSSEKTFSSLWVYSEYEDDVVDEGNGVYAITVTSPSSLSFVRITNSLAEGYTADDVIITVNEPIQ